MERLIAWWMTDAFPPVGSPSHPLPPPSKPKGRRRKKRSGGGVDVNDNDTNTRVFSTPRGTPQRVPIARKAANTTLGDMSRWNDDNKDRNDEKSGDDVDAISRIRPSPYTTLLPRDAPDDGFLSPSLLSTKGKGSTFVGDFFFHSSNNNNNNNNLGQGKRGSDSKGVLLPMYTTSLVLDDDDGRETKAGVTLEELRLEGEQDMKKDLVKLGTVMNSTKGDVVRPVEKIGGKTKLPFEDEEEEEEEEDGGVSDAASDTSSQAAALLLQVETRVPFDRFAQWFLGLARELGHRGGGRQRQGRRKGNRAGELD